MIYAKLTPNDVVLGLRVLTPLYALNRMTTYHIKEYSSGQLVCSGIKDLDQTANPDIRVFVPFLCILTYIFTHSSRNISKTCLYNFDPLKPHFYIAKLGFTGVYIIFPIFAQNHRL